MSDLLPAKKTLSTSVVDNLCDFRNQALVKMDEAIAALEAGYEMAHEAQILAKKAHHGAYFHLSKRDQLSAYQALFQSFDPESSRVAYRQDLDARLWTHLLNVTDLDSLMDREEREKLSKSLCDDVPEATPDNIMATFKRLRDESPLIFQRGLANCFSQLDRRFKSHDAFKIGSRIILTRVFNGWGWMEEMSGATITDVERVFAVLDTEPAQQLRCRDTSLISQIQKDRGHIWGPCQSVTENRYFRIRAFKNGNAHLWMLRDDLVEKANLILADYYGEVLPDAVSRDEEPSRCTDLATNLSFYPSPPHVVKSLIRDLYLPEESRVLEPSAGTGCIVSEILKRDVRVDAVEVHPDRAREIEQLPHKKGQLQVRIGNFLQMEPDPVYTHVVMNPPFYGTHWMDHVRHAFDFLAPGGVLRAVLPISADLGQTSKHLKFREWARKNNKHQEYSLFRDLPPESFADSGTRINTLILTLWR